MGKLPYRSLNNLSEVTRPGKSGGRFQVQSSCPLAHLPHGGGTQQWSMKRAAGLSPGPDMGRERWPVPSVTCLRFTGTWDPFPSLVAQSVQDQSSCTSGVLLICAHGSAAASVPGAGASAVSPGASQEAYLEEVSRAPKSKDISVKAKRKDGQRQLL